MTFTEADTGTLRRYLLGRLAPEAQNRLETQLMTDDGGLEEHVQAAEEELIDEFVRSELTATERQGFRERFLNTPERRARVAFARTLDHYVEREAAAARPAAPERRAKLLTFRPKLPTFRLPAFVGQPARSLAMAAALTAVTVGGVWLYVGTERLERELVVAHAERTVLEERATTAQEQLSEQRARSDEIAGRLQGERDRSAALEEELAAVRSAGAVTAIASVWLSPGLVRGGGEIERVILPADVTVVRLLLDLGIDDYESYRVSLMDAEGDELWTQAKLDAENLRGRVAVAVSLPATLLAPGDYAIRLYGVTGTGTTELAGRYYLRALPE